VGVRRELGKYDNNRERSKESRKCMKEVKEGSDGEEEEEGEVVCLVAGSSTFP
jgi:hypothetical protein